MSEDEYEMEDEYDFSDASHNPYFTDEKNGISSWDYRLIRGENGLLTIGEVYYNSDGIPVGWILEAPVPESENVEEIISELKMMLDAAQKPVFQIPEN